jgi:hypothetical protein
MRCDRLGYGVFSFWLFAILGFVTRENTPLLFLGQSTTFGYISSSPTYGKLELMNFIQKQ